MKLFLFILAIPVFGQTMLPTRTLNNPSTDCSIDTLSLAQGTLGVFYSQTLTTSGCVSPVTWSLLGSLPGGLALDPSGIIQGTPNTVQVSTFTIQAVDSTSATVLVTLTITIVYPASGPISFKGKITLGGKISTK